MDAIWEKIKKSEGIAFVAMLPIIAFYFLPFVLWMQAQVILFGLHGIVFGETANPTPLSEVCWSFVTKLHLLLGAVFFVGWTVLFLAILVGHPIRF